VRLQHLAHRKLPGGGQVDQLTIAIQEHLTRLGTELRPQKQPLNTELPLSELNSFPQCFYGDAVFGAESAKNVCLDQVPKGKNRRFP
jgi:hypothetical protein